MSIGPFSDSQTCTSHFQTAAQAGDWNVMTVFAENLEEVQGTASFTRRREAHGSAEIGFVLFSPNLQRTRGATEAVYLMLKHLFDDLNYRRVEWKCDTKNLPSKRAAHRFGFTPEGVFRQDLIIKGKNRDTAWFSMIDSEWPAIKQAYEIWLTPTNFDLEGRQLTALATP